MSVMDFPDDFDPRKDDFHSMNAQAYSSGIGAQMQNALNGSSCVTIHVSRVPSSVGEVQLMNLFSQCGKPTIRDIKRNKRYPINDVYVEYSNMSEAQSAVRRYHNQPPFYFALSIDEPKSQNRQEAPVFNGSTLVPDQMALATRDQIDRSTENLPAAALPPIYHPIYRMIRPLEEWKNGSLEDYHLGRMYEQSLPLSDHRKVFGGRVYWYRPRNLSKKCDTKPAFKHVKNLRLAKSKLLHEAGEEPETPDRSIKQDCAHCGLLSNSYCNRCKEVFYCCPGCLKKDWPKHKLVCRKRDGETTTARQIESAGIKCNFEVNGDNMSPRENGGNFNESKSLRRPAEANMYLRPSSRKSAPQNHKNQFDSTSNASDTNSVKTMTNDNYRKSDSKKSAPQNVNQNRHRFDSMSNASDSSSVKTMTDDNDRKSDPNNRNYHNKKNNFNNNDAARNARPTTPAASAKAPVQQSNKVEATTNVQSVIEVKKRIEAGMVKNVFISHLDSLTDLWVQCVDDAEALADLIFQLNKRISDSSPGLSGAVVDEWCCKNYEGDWTRARILCAEPLQIIYVDYGNSEEATLDQLKVLPADLAAQVPPFAISVHLAAGLSSANSAAQTVFPITFLSERGHGQWLVERASDVPKVEEPKQHEEVLGSHKPVPAAGATSPSASTAKAPYFTEGEICEVIFSELEDETNNIWYVTKYDKKEVIDNIQMELNKKVSNNSPQLEDIAVSKKCAAKFDGIWYRASVRQLDPLKVLYIDYGNEEVCKPDDLKQLPQEFKEIGLLTVRVRLASALTPVTLKVITSGPVKLRVAKKDGKYWLADFATAEQSTSNAGVSVEMPVEAAGSTTLQQPKSRPEPNPELSLLPNEEDTRLDNYKKIIETSKMNDTAYCETTRVLSRSIFTCIMAHDNAKHAVNKICCLDLGSPSDKTYRPQINEMVAVYRENMDPAWRRGLVLSEMNGSYNLALVDCGLLVVSSNIKELPDDFKNIALLSVNLSLESSPPFQVQTGEVLRVKMVKKLADSHEWEVDVHSPNKHSFHLGVGRLSSWKIEADHVPELAKQKLESGSEVIISSFHHVNSIYVRPATSKLIELYECLSQEVAAECSQADNLGRDPFVGELVAAEWDKDSNYYRAQILGKAEQKNCYKVLFVDYGNIDKVHTSNMKPISNKLKSVPCGAIKVGLEGVEARTLTPAAYQYGIKIADKMDLLKIEFQVLEEVQLTKLSDNTNVNKTICELLVPSWIRESHLNTSLALQKYPMLQDLPEPNREDRFQIGITEKVLVSYVAPFKVVQNGTIELVVCKASERLLMVYTKILSDQMTDYIASQKEESNRYVPHTGELCICLGEHDTPMRAVCLKILDANTALMTYVDFGGEFAVNFNRIFKMTSDLMQLPAFATPCFADGFPASITYEKVSSALSELDACDAEIKSFDNVFYFIHIPELIARVS